MLAADSGQDACWQAVAVELALEPFGLGYSGLLISGRTSPSYADLPTAAASPDTSQPSQAPKAQQVTAMLAMMKTVPAASEGRHWPD